MMIFFGWGPRSVFRRVFVVSGYVWSNRAVFEDWCVLG